MDKYSQHTRNHIWNQNGPKLNFEPRSCIDDTPTNNRYLKQNKNLKCKSAKPENNIYYYPQFREYLPKLTQYNSLISPRYFGQTCDEPKSQTEVIYKNTHFNRPKSAKPQQRVTFADELTEIGYSPRIPEHFCTCHHKSTRVKETKSEPFNVSKRASHGKTNSEIFIKNENPTKLTKHQLMQNLLGTYEKKKAEQERNAKLSLENEPNVDTSALKVNEDYLRKMEEKIFNIKIDPHKSNPATLANIRRMLHKSQENETEVINIKEDKPIKANLEVVANLRKKLVLIPNISIHERFRAVHNELLGMERWSLQEAKSNKSLSKRGSQHQEMMLELKENKIYESQHQRFLTPKSSKTELPETALKKSEVDLVNKSSNKSVRSNSVPPAKKATRRKNPRMVDLFNPSYSFEKNSNFTTMGKGLLESIRTKVFGFKTATTTKIENDEEWADQSSLENCKLPKETRHSLTKCNIDQSTKLCQTCSQSIKQIKKIDAQTSPDASLTKIKVVEKIGNKPVIPCHLNLLCEKGLHIGKCEDKVREKIQKPVCHKNCICRSENNMQEDNWPGKAKRISDTDNTIKKAKQSGQSIEDVGIKLEPKESVETFLKLMEPMSCVSSEFDKIEIPKKQHKSSDSKASKIMNGLNGHTNGSGELHGCGDIITQNQQKGCWTIGLINSKYRYLTAETFGFKINANGTSLKKKQIWTLEPENAAGADSMIYLRSHLDKYLAVDSFGNVTCESEEKDPGSKFQISVSEDGSGRWALKNVVRGYFLGSTLDKLTCTAKSPSDAEFWHVHLAARPQVNLRSVGRKRFAHLSENLDEIHVDANIPWGEDTLFTLEFRLDESGKYAIHTCNNKYLSMGGKLVDACNKDCLFSAEYHSGQLALRDRTGAYLSPIGSKAVLKTRSNSVTKDELFSLEDSLPQASFVASLNSRFVSVKQGVDVTANQDEISDHETFQLEFDWSTKRWYIRTMQDRYWTLETGGGIQASGDKRSSNALFDLVWQGDGSLAFRANNGRYVITKRSGHLYATADAIEDNCKYYFYLINRPILVLKCEQGFVGYKSASSPKLECNKATYESIQVERGEKGVVHFKGQNGKFWHVDSDGVTADSDTQEGFYLELREPTRLCIKTTNGNYLTASKNGLFRLGDTTIENATQWEY